ncbi:MAG TPA: hypothetical protein VM487_04325 [Phycisphaerae bacterium]|nr:hypothetical protein [Phycisphaerae bacterium]
MAEGNYTFAGVNEVEAQDRTSEHRTGVPSAGSGLAALMAAPVGKTTSVKLVNFGSHPAEVRLRHGSSTKTVAAELLIALAQGGGTTIYIGGLQFGSIVPGSITVTDPGANPLLVDDAAQPGLLFETGTTVQRGTINYVTGAISITYGAAATEPVVIAYQHTAPVDFASPVQTTAQAAAAYPFVMPLAFGRVNPGSVVIVDSAAPPTFVDDGKGNIIDNTAAAEQVAGTIDYATGIITITAASAVLAGTVTATFTFNPFGKLLSAGGGSGSSTLYPGDIPELSDEPWADGIRGEDEVFLVGASRVQATSALITQWSHWGEEPYRVRGIFSEFAPGGHDNRAV